ncbi:fasciclin domain-containing protein [uncultured Pontibacter sp.]|uniref:fasciclin domain-containing protein n=1 Tax=uncultured Pontibacter sp. TaxID=453356 RepID=UPI00260C51D8|nr:fasciclin domain-containing protein [uncultured Pontibacter sp.]
MKKNFLKPLAVMTLSTFVLFGCASSEETTAMEDTTMEDTSMSETETMAGDVTDMEGYEVLVVEEQITVPIVTLPATALMMENPEEIDQMFEGIDNTERYDVMELARKSPNLSTFVKLIEQAQLEDDIQRVERLTLFAPTNEAFAKLPKAELENLLLGDNYAALSRMVQNHIVSSDLASTQLQNNDRIRITDTSYIMLDSDNNLGTTRIGGAQILRSDIEASNGRIHVIDAVITPTND